MEIVRVVAQNVADWIVAVEHLVPTQDRNGKTAAQADVLAALKARSCYLFLAKKSSNPIGLISAYRLPDIESGGHVVYLYNLLVDPLHRNKGVGRQLVEALLKCCIEDGVNQIWCGTDLRNHAAQSVFKATGAELLSDTYKEYVYKLNGPTSRGT